jgi:hypothetical protein
MTKKLIPLIRPQQVPVNKFWPFFEQSINECRLANIGPAYLQANKLIEDLMTYNCMLSNATVGLELAVRARFKPRSRIMIPSFTFKATYLAVKNAGMIPVCSAVNEQTWLLEPDDIVQSECDGAIVVSPFGFSFRFDTYETLGVPIIYDLAGAWGLHYKGPNIAVYSWHATKNFCVGEGCCVVSSDFQVIQDILRLSNFGYTNGKISEIQCAIACSLLVDGVKYHDETYAGYLTGLGSRVRACILPHDFASLLVFSFPKEKIYKITTNETFECRRYYHHLVEDAYECEAFRETHLDHPTRSTVALPRDISPDEQEIILDALGKILNGA